MSHWACQFVNTENSWNERDKNNVHKQIFVFDDFGLQSLSILILWFDLRKVCICGCVIDPKGRWAWSKDERSSRAVDLILKVDLSGSSKGLLGLIFEEQWRTDLQGLLGLILKNSDERISEGFWAWTRRTVTNGSSRAFGLERIFEGFWAWSRRTVMNDERFLQGPSGLGLDEQRMSGFVDVVDPKGLLGLDPWGWTVDERWTLSSRGRWGLGLKVDDCWSKGRRAWSWKNDERRTLSWFFGNLDAWELRSFRASELQGVISIGSPLQMNEMGLYL